MSSAIRLRLHLIRHTSVDVPAGVCYGRSDVPLRPSFADEAHSVRQRLQLLLEGRSPWAVYSSPLSRSLRLARYCGYSPQLDERLLELNFGQWELQRFEDIRDPQLERWYADYLHVAPTEGESFVTQVARVGYFLEELRALKQRLTPGTYELLAFAHGGVLAAARVHCGLCPLEEAFARIDPYGAICTLEL